MVVQLESISTLANATVYILLIGMSFFVVALLSMIFLFGLSTREALQNVKGVAVLLMASLTVPYSVFYFQHNMISSQAEASKSLEKFEVVDIDEGTSLLSFETKEKSRAYVMKVENDGEAVPVLPTSDLEERISHTFVLEKGAQIYFVVDGASLYLNDDLYLIQ